MKKEFKVVKIIGDTALIINAGENDGVNIGDEVEIRSEGEDIIDPDTNENLGHYDVLKDTLKVIEVYDKMCVCETKNISNIINASVLFKTEQKKLNVLPAEISSSGSKIIRIGDRAILLEKNILD